MNMSKRAQGLPINTIILIAIGLLILVLFITFVLGGFKGVGGATNPNAAAEQAFAGQCSTACSEATTGGTLATWCAYPNSSITNSAGAPYSCGTVPGGTSSCTVGGVAYTWTSASCIADR